MSADDVNDQRIVVVGAIVIAAVIVSVLAALGLGAWLTERAGAPISPTVPPALAQQFPTPRLEHDPRQERDEYFAQKQHELSSYGWVDRAHRVVHIPIERAMELLAQRTTGAGRSGEH